MNSTSRFGCWQLWPSLQPLMSLGFSKVCQRIPLDAPAQAIIDYFEDTYIGRLRPGCQRQDPLFPITVWNMYEQTLQGFLRTNNAMDGWHRSFQANVEGCHPNFWKFIDILK